MEKSLKDKNYNLEILSAINDLKNHDDKEKALHECYLRALDDRNRDLKKALLEFYKFIQEYKKSPIFNIEDFEREFKEIFIWWDK